MANRTYTIPLRRETLKARNYKRTEKAVRVVREFLQKHMKAEPADVKLGPHLNEQLWSRGIKSPPGKVKVTVSKDNEGVVRAELVDAPAFVAPQKKDDKNAKKTAVEKAKEALAGKEKEVKKAVEKKAEEKKAEAPKEAKKEAPAKAEAKPAAKKDDAPQDAKK